MTARTSILLTLALTFTVYSQAQINDQEIRQEVLKKAVIDSSFVFGKWTKSGGTETHLKYLGQLTTRQGKVFKILNSTWIWGLSQRATSRILVFNDKDKYVGNYSVTIIADLPTSMQNGKLIFKNTDEDCDKKLTTIIDLTKGLPKQFFRKCKGKFGDIYSFDTE